MFSNLFKLRGELGSNQRLILGFIGVLLLLAIWTGLAYSKSKVVPIYETMSNELPSMDLPEAVRDSIINVLVQTDSLAEANATEFERIYPILSPPHKVVASFPDLLKKDRLTINTFKSLWLNIKGYFFALLIAIPLGFVVGLLPIFNGMFNKPVDALRYLPLTALTGLFMAWFGTEDKMKVAFLAFGIIVYLLPIVAQRINEVKAVYLKTVFTLGATSWQTIKSVYIPSVLSKVSDDIRVLTAISWTYIIVAELVNSSQGGIGAMIYKSARFASKEKVFALLVVIIVIGLLQDKYFTYLDRKLFPFKHKSDEAKEVSLLGSMFRYIFTLLSVLYVLLSIWPTGRAIIQEFIGDGFYIFLALAIIELLLELNSRWPALSEKLFSKKTPQPA